MIQQLHWSIWGSLPCSRALCQQLVMKRRADIEILIPLIPVCRSFGLTSSLINKTASSVRRPSNNPDDNEAISRQAKQLTWLLTLTPDDNGPVSAWFNSSDLRGGRSSCWQEGRRSQPPTQQHSQELPGIFIKDSSDARAESHSGTDAFHDFYVTFCNWASPRYVNVLPFHSFFFSVGFPKGEQSL